jgi:hypothetical protein
MKPDNPTIAPTTAVADSPASARLAHNRLRMANWLEHDRAVQAQPLLGGWAARAVLPLVEGLRQHPTASLALGALAQAWLRPTAPARGGGPALESQVLAAALSAVRKHPKTTLAVAALAGAAWWWNRSRARPAHPP